MQSSRRNASLPAVLMCALLVGCVAGSSPSSSSSALASAAGSVSSSSPAESLPAEPPDPTATVDLRFHLSLFGTPEGQARASALTTLRGELIAVGVEYAHRLPILGPTPVHEGRVWWSADGRTWQDVTPRGLFGNVSLETLIRRPDDTLLAVGTVSAENDNGDLEASTSGAWESPDGRTWKATSTGLPRDRWMRDAVQGERGILADVWKVGDTHGSELWYSSDGRTWQMVRRLMDGSFGMDAGDEGFVVVGSQGPYGEPSTPLALASADGREWFEAPAPPDDLADVAAIEGDWLALSVPWDPAARAYSFATWHSSNGLDWSPAEDVQLGRSGTAGEPDCPLQPSLESADRYVVLRSYWSGLCSEGGVVNYGPHQLAVDGGGWHELALSPEDTAANEWVAESAVFDGQVVFAGEASGQAAFWLGDQ